MSQNMLNSEPLTALSLQGMLYTSFIGVILSIIIGLYILINVIQKYRSKFLKPKESSAENKIPYILVIIYATFIILASLSLGSLRTNLFSRTTISTYTTLYCQMGVIIYYCFVYPSFLLVHIIIIYRIQSIFSGSIYAYPSYVYHTLYTLSITVNSFGIIYSIIQVGFEALGQIHWIVVYTPSKTFNFCRINDEENTSQESWFRLPLVISCGIINFLINIALLFMFNRGLWLLNAKDMVGVRRGIEPQIIERELAPISERTTNKEPHYIAGEPHYVSQKSESVASAVSVDECPSPKRRATSSEDLKIIIEYYNAKKKAKEKVDGSVKRVINMYNIMKKQTILISIAIASSSIFFIWTGYDSYAAIEICWDFSVNLICAWLMLKSSETCWNWCKTKGLCLCCYLNT